MCCCSCDTCVNARSQQACSRSCGDQSLCSKTSPLKASLARLMLCNMISAQGHLLLCL